MNTEHKYFVDTNILVHSTLKDFEPEKHKKAKQIIEQLLNEDNSLYTSPQTYCSSWIS
jgi:predicted nucleic acid-binding protein